MDGGSNSSPTGQVTTPSIQNPPVPGRNLLNVPMIQSSGGNHQRSPSFGSTGTSAWTSTPSTGLPASDIGDNKGDLRELIKAEPNEPEIPNNPFAFTPKDLAKLHDPKNLKILRAMGGLAGLVYGLWTDTKTGLSPEEDKIDGRRTLQDVLHELETRRRDKVQQDIEDEKALEVGDGEERDPEKIQQTQRTDTRKSTASKRPTIASMRTQPVASKGFSDRKYVFSENRIPARKPKNIFQLMWMALHDKILVCLPLCYSLQ